MLFLLLTGQNVICLRRFVNKVVKGLFGGILYFRSGALFKMASFKINPHRCYATSVHTANKSPPPFPYPPGLTYGQVNGGASRHWFGGGDGFGGGGWYEVV